MQLTNFCEFERDLPDDSVSVSRNDFDPGYEDEASFERTRGRSQSHRRKLSEPTLAHRRASAIDDDEVADIALHFGNV